MADHRSSTPDRSPTSQAEGQLLTKVGTLPVVVFWHDEHGVRDRGPLPAPRVPAAPGHRRGRARHLPLAPRPLRPRVGLHARPVGRRRARLRRRRPRRRRVRARRAPTPTRSAISKRACATASRTTSRSSSPSRCSGCSTRTSAAAEIVRTGVEFGTAYRDTGWGAGLTVLVAMANLLPHLDPDDRALALVARPRVRRARHAQPRAALRGRARSRRNELPVDRLAGWYRRFVDTRSSDAAERTLETALADCGTPRPTSRR